jgi:hypothetical protein
VSFELAKKAYGYVKAIWPWILKQWADFQGLPSSQKGLVLGALGLLAVFVLAAAGAAFLFFEGPLLLNIRNGRCCSPTQPSPS